MEASQKWWIVVNQHVKVQSGACSRDDFKKLGASCQFLKQVWARISLILRFDQNDRAIPVVSPVISPTKSCDLKSSVRNVLWFLLLTWRNADKNHPKRLHCSTSRRREFHERVSTPRWETTIAWCRWRLPPKASLKSPGRVGWIFGFTALYQIRLKLSDYDILQSIWCELSEVRTNYTARNDRYNKLPIWAFVQTVLLFHTGWLRTGFPSCVERSQYIHIGHIGSHYYIYIYICIYICIYVLYIL